MRRHIFEDVSGASEVPRKVAELLEAEGFYVEIEGEEGRSVVSAERSGLVAKIAGVAHAAVVLVNKGTCVSLQLSTGHHLIGGAEERLWEALVHRVDPDSLICPRDGMVFTSDDTYREHASLHEKDALKFKNDYDASPGAYF